MDFVMVMQEQLFRNTDSNTGLFQIHKCLALILDYVTFPAGGVGSISTSDAIHDYENERG
jgi:hypothetical protein